MGHRAAVAAVSAALLVGCGPSVEEVVHTPDCAVSAVTEVPAVAGMTSLLDHTLACPDAGVVTLDAASSWTGLQLEVVDRENQPTTRIERASKSGDTKCVSGIRSPVRATVALRDGTMVFGVAELVAYCSRLATLHPGDIVATGTPEGVGYARKPPRWLVPGDSVDVEVEQVGVLTNPVAAE